MTEVEIDVRPLPKADKHPAIFEAYAARQVGESLLLVNNHNPRHLRDEFTLEFPGGFGWDYEESGPAQWRIRITKLASTALPRVLGDTATILGEHPDVSGAVWKLQMGERDLDANIINLPPSGAIASHQGPDLDVLLFVLSGDGRIETERGTVEVRSGSLVWLPRRSRRAILAGGHGLQYLTAHQRRTGLLLEVAHRPAASLLPAQ
jgi:uncharacterized protein (DUF2249 family)/quercetin dioxygenase-like cupin family protein